MLDLIQVGWWVIDEINSAKKTGFIWQNDPTNDRFKYKIDLATLANAMVIWNDVEVQESRNGYILHKIDIT